MFTCGPAFWLLTGTPSYFSSVIYQNTFNTGVSVDLTDDQSSYNQTTGFAVATITTSTPIEGAQSVSFAGVNTAEHVAYTPGSEGILGTGDWTFEIKIDAGTQSRTTPLIMAMMPQFGPTWQAGNMAFHLNHGSPNNDKLTFWVYNYATSAPLLSGTSNLIGAGVKHVAVSRVGDDWYLAVDGAIEATATWSGSVNSSALRMFIGGSDNATIDGFVGKIDMVRETVGVGRYTTAYTVPTSYPTS